MKSLRREVDVIRQKTKRENDQIRKNRDLSDAEFVRKNNELEAKNLRLQGSILHRDFFLFFLSRLCSTESFCLSSKGPFKIPFC